MNVILVILDSLRGDHVGAYAQEEPETVEKMFEEYVLKDAGGSLPNY